MKNKPTHYGVINEDSFSLRSPRMIDSDECETLTEAFKAAEEMVENGAEQVSIVRCFYNKKHDCWFEAVGAGTIQIEAGSWICDDEFEEGLTATNETKASDEYA